MDALRRVRMFLTQRHRGTEQWCVNFLITGRKGLRPLPTPKGLLKLSASSAALREIRRERRDNGGLPIRISL